MVSDFPIDTKVIIISTEMSVTWYCYTTHNMLTNNDPF